MNITSSAAVPLLWVPEPNFRGTFDIFSLCLSTMVISVWSAVHFDIPTKRQSVISSFRTSVLWMLAALFCPELLLLIAFNQRGNAIRIVNCAEKLLPARNAKAEKKKGFFRRLFSFCSGSTPNVDEKAEEDLATGTKSLRRYPFTMVHGFYAAMGGFVFDFMDDDGQPVDSTFLPGNRTRMTITSTGIHFLMEHHPELILDISQNSITDRTRASSLSKAILLAQITWFCTNCIARLGQGLPLSLLEVTTVAHALCTLLTYLLWWNKPLNVAEPTLIRGRDAREACALMAMCSADEKHMLFGTVSIQFPAEMASIETSNEAGDSPDSGCSRSSSVSIRTTRRLEDGTCTERPSELQTAPFVTLRPEQDVAPNTNFTPKKEACKTPYFSWKVSTLYDRRSIPWYARHREPEEPLSLRSVDINRWTLASSALRRYGLDQKTIEIPQKPYLTPHSTLQSSSDFKGRGIQAIIRSNLSASALTVIYGLPHFLAWNAHFPTPLERRLWRIATVSVTIWGGCMAFVVALIAVIRVLMRNFTGERRGEAMLVLCAALPYIVNSDFLLFESLRQLLYLEPAAYALPSWPNFWPHFA